MKLILSIISFVIFVLPLAARTMNHGPFLTHDLWFGNKLMALKGIAIRLSPDEKAGVCFDTDTLAMVAGWTEGYLNYKKTHLALLKGTGECQIDGTLVFSNPIGPGWSFDKSYADPRKQGLGPLPENMAKYKGLYLNGDKTILKYTVGDCEILELPTLNNGNIVRTIEARMRSRDMYLRICTGNDVKIESTGRAGSLGTLRISIHGDPAIKLQSIQDAMLLKLPAGAATSKFAIVFGEAAAETKPVHLDELCKGGETRWPQIITTKGVLGSDDKAHTRDEIELPDNNPWNAWMRMSAMDFFKDGRLAISTLNGDVWLVSGLNEKLEQIHWKRFATGLYEPLGLKIVDDKIYVLGRDQITRLHDLNGNSEADYYENFNNEMIVHPNYHAFAFDLQIDSKGNFYHARDGHRVPGNYPGAGGIFMVSPDGKNYRLFAGGLRAPNGMGIGPGDLITCGDNPHVARCSASPIHAITPNAFLGYVDHHHQMTKPGPELYKRPIVWIPHSVDRSSGSQVWVEDDRFGPALKGKMLHTSYGNCRLFMVMIQEKDGELQGGVSQFPLVFSSGIMRARFNPLDGQLYVCGLKGWDSSAAKVGELSRVRYTGKPLLLPISVNAFKSGIVLEFDVALNRTAALSADNYSIKEANFPWDGTGYDKSTGIEKNYAPLQLSGIDLSKDGKKLSIKIPNIKKVMSMEIKYNIITADGLELTGVIYNTINYLY